MAKHHPHPRALIGNLRQPMPLRRKLRLVVANTFTKVRTRRSCCGNHGQPGC